jgi:hypothetical protein
VPRQRGPAVGEDPRLNALTLQENRVTLTRDLASNNDISHVTVLRILRSAKLHPYKMQAVQKLAIHGEVNTIIILWM